MRAGSLGVLILSLAVLALSGCHTGGQSGEPTTVISGMASKGPVTGGTVKVYAIRNGVPDTTASIGEAQTDGNGDYSVSLGAYTGPVLVMATGGAFKDEVSGASVTLKTPLRAVLSNAATGAQTVAVTPLTELAYQKAVGAGTLTPASIDDANAKISAFFHVSDIVSTLPSASGGGGDQKQYAAVLGSFAQYVNNNKNKNESLDDALPRLLAQMGDEVKNTGGFSIGTINAVNTAITDFANSGKNQTGAAVAPLPAPTSGILKLSTGGTATIGAIEVTVNFPAGVMALADAGTGETAAGVVTVSGAAAAGNSLSTAKFTPASGGSPAQLHIALINTAGFETGEFVTIRFDLDAGGSFPAGVSEFAVASFTALGTTGSSISGMTALPSSVAAELK